MSDTTSAPKPSFFSKIKQFLGIGGIKVELDLDPQITFKTTKLTGTITLTAKSDQLVKSITYKLEEEWTRKVGDETKTKHFTLGEKEITDEFTMKEGETKKISFELPIAFVKNNEDQLKEMGGAMGALGKLSALTDGQKSVFTFIAKPDVDGTFLDPSATQKMELKV
jgi:hypothetical protein